MNITAKLSTEARAALTNASKGSAIGSVISDRTAPAVVDELLKAGLIGSAFGLTMKGQIIRDRIQTEDLDRLFPL